jgi:hypothetical protein
VQAPSITTTVADGCAVSMTNNESTVRQKTSALRNFDPAYDRSGSFTSFLLSRRVRFAPRAEALRQRRVPRC